MVRLTAFAIALILAPRAFAQHLKPQEAPPVEPASEVPS